MKIKKNVHPITKLKDVMTNEVVYLLPHHKVFQAAHIMKSLNVGIIPICDEQQQLLGVVTDRDIVLRVVAEGKSPQDTCLIDIATKNVFVASPDWLASQAIDLMSQHQVRRLPIVQNNRLVGLVSIGDIAILAPAVDTSLALEEISQPALFRIDVAGDK